MPFNTREYTPPLERISQPVFSASGRAQPPSDTTVYGTFPTNGFQRPPFSVVSCPHATEKTGSGSILSCVSYDRIEEMGDQTGSRPQPRSLDTIEDMDRQTIA